VRRFETAAFERPSVSPDNHVPDTEEIDKRVEYWRDQVSLLLKSGAAIIVLFAGWAISHHKEFLLDCDDPWGRDRSVAAIGLLSMSLVYAAFLPLSVAYIYSGDRLGEKAEKTLIPKKLAIGMAGLLGLGGLLIAAAMSLR
jgi:hypothetical protein